MRVCVDHSEHKPVCVKQNLKWIYTISMTKAPIKIVSRWEFEHIGLNDYLF